MHLYIYVCMYVCMISDGRVSLTGRLVFLFEANICELNLQTEPSIRGTQSQGDSMKDSYDGCILTKPSIEYSKT